MNIYLSPRDMVLLATYEVMRKHFPNDCDIAWLPERLRPIAERW